MLTGAAALTASCLAGGTLWRLAHREREAERRRRARLLDQAAALFPSGSVTMGPDGFPTFSTTHASGGGIDLGLVADTLVTRRLPQLWLKLTLREAAPARDFALGALARPTGAEFYALTHDLPDWIEPPAAEVPLLLRGRNVEPGAAARDGALLAALFSDPALKEAAVTPRGVRIVRQVCQGERGAHLLLRQARFPLEAVARDTLRAALRDAERLSETLRTRSSIIAEAA